MCSSDLDHQGGVSPSSCGWHPVLGRGTDGQRQGAVPQPQAGCEVGCEGCGGPRGGDEDGAGAYEQLEAAAGAGCGVERTTGREIKLSPRFFLCSVSRYINLDVISMGGVGMDTSIIREEMNRLDKISGLDTSEVPIRISSRMTDRKSVV